jgi:hypothetical protein
VAFCKQPVDFSGTLRHGLPRQGLQGIAFLIAQDCTKNGEDLKRVFTALLVRPSPPSWTVDQQALVFQRSVVRIVETRKIRSASRRDLRVDSDVSTS